MPSRLPVNADFPNVALSVSPAPDSKPPTNILLLLHGLGDSKAPLQKLGQQMSLPETVCLAVRGPNPVPFQDGGAHWGDDLIFDSGTGDIDADTGFKNAIDLLVRRILRPLIDHCGYRSRDVYLFGFGQGGMAALAAANALPVAEELGGVISIGGPLPGECAYPVAKSETPVILLGGSSASQLSPDKVECVERAFDMVQYKRWSRPTDAMPSNREEMLPIMEFLARRMKSRAGVPEGSMELA